MLLYGCAHVFTCKFGVCLYSKECVDILCQKESHFFELCSDIVFEYVCVSVCEGSTLIWCADFFQKHEKPGSGYTLPSSVSSLVCVRV